MFGNLDCQQARCYLGRQYSASVQFSESAFIVNEPQEARPPKPVLSLRVGITGLRRLRIDQIDRIRQQMGEVLNLACQEMKTLAENPGVCPYYSHEPDTNPIPQLRMVSPLARGADRVAAKAALDRGYELFVPMPFAQDEYVKDFTGSKPDDPDEVPRTPQQDRDEFDQLLEAATGTIQLDGGRKLFPTDEDNSLEGFSYEYVGHFVVRHCDLLVAIWDGKVSRGRGGTADIVRYAATVGVPVWWIDATTDCEPAWLADRHDWRDIDPTKPGGSKLPPAASCLTTYLQQLVLMPEFTKRHGHRSGAQDAKPQSRPAQVYFDELPLPNYFFWNTYNKMMSLFKPPSKSSPAGPGPQGMVQRHWHDRREIAGARAGEYAARYRSSYVLIIALATLALGLGSFAIGIVVAQETGFCKTPEWLATAITGFELVFLIGVIVFAVLAQGRQWHVRSIEYRLLAELFRKQETLAALGWSLSIGNVRNLTDAKRQSWVSWLFAATQRGAPLQHGDMTSLEQRMENQRILVDLIDEQIDYHKVRGATSHKGAKVFEHAGVWVFGAVIVCVFAKLAMEGVELHSKSHLFHPIILMGLLATFLPGVSAACVGIRSYAELQLLAEQSRHMIAELDAAMVRVQQLHLDRDLASQDLGTEAVGVAMMMLNDLDGWGRLFRGKVAGPA